MSEFKFEQHDRIFRNEGYLFGTIEEPLKPISLEGRDLFTTKICVPRMSGKRDVIPVLVTDELYSMVSTHPQGENIFVEGFFRSFSPLTKLGLFRYFFEVENIRPLVKNFARNNSIHLCGNVCIAPRGVGRNENLTYFNLAVQVPNRNMFDCYARESYKAAARSLNVGDYVELYGRIQSLEPKNPDKPVTYPICVSKFDVIGYKGTRVNYTPKFTPIKYRDQ